MAVMDRARDPAEDLVLEDAMMGVILRANILVLVFVKVLVKGVVKGVVV
jgi:hypothetical protein